MKHFVTHTLECGFYCLGFHLLDAKFLLTEHLIHFLQYIGLW